MIRQDRYEHELNQARWKAHLDEISRRKWFERTEARIRNIQAGTNDAQTGDTAAEYVDAYAKAYAEGYAKGYAEGYAEGRAEGLAASLRSQVQLLQSLLQMKEYSLQDLEQLSNSELKHLIEELESQFKSKTKQI